MLLLHYELAEQLAELHPGYTSLYPRKKNIWWYLACYNALEGALCCISIIALALWSDLADSNHPACLHQKHHPTDTGQKK